MEAETDFISLPEITRLLYDKRAKQVYTPCSLYHSHLTDLTF